MPVVVWMSILETEGKILADCRDFTLDIYTKERGGTTMIQDIGPHRYDNAFRAKRPVRESRLLYFKQKQVLARLDETELEFPTFGELEAENDGLYDNAVFLFSIDGEDFFLAGDVAWPPLAGWGLINTEIFRRAKPKHMAFAGVTGLQLYNWYRSRRFCGRCGGPMEHDGRERMMRCPGCGNVEYPRICPAVIVGVTHGNRLLMSKYAGGGYKRYALIAGFAEVGETIEETVKREVMEEVGLRVKNPRYYKSQPWSLSESLLFGFFAELDSSEEITLDETELSEAAWFEREEIQVEEEDFSLTNEMIYRFKRGEI